MKHKNIINRLVLCESVAILFFCWCIFCIWILTKYLKIVPEPFPCVVCWKHRGFWNYKSCFLHRDRIHLNKLWVRLLVESRFFMYSILNFFFAFFKRVRSPRQAKVQFLLALTQSVDRCIVITVSLRKESNLWSRYLRKI